MMNLLGSIQGLVTSIFRPESGLKGKINFFVTILKTKKGNLLKIYPKKQFL